MMGVSVFGSVESMETLVGVDLDIRGRDGLKKLLMCLTCIIGKMVVAFTE